MIMKAGIRLHMLASEFYGVWGDFDVKISIDKSYILGGTGYLQNPDQIGFGYEKAGQKLQDQQVIN